jgi:hypothetical protein
MFTTIMYGFINEVTRQPASAEIPLRTKRRGGQARTAARSPSNVRRVRNPTRRQAQLPGRYRVLADSFKCAAGFY